MAAWTRGVCRHWEKGLLALSGVTLLSTLLFHALAVPTDPVAGALGGRAAELDRSLARPLALVEPAAPVFHLVEDAFADPVEAEPGGDWVFHRQPEVRVAVRVVRDPTGGDGRPPVFRAPALVKVDAAAGRVALEWQDDPRNNVRPTGYHVYRRPAGGGDFRRITAEPVKEKAFADRAVEPRAAYEYAVAAVTDDRRVGAPEGGRSEPLSVRALDVFRLELVGHAEGGDGVPVAVVRVRRFFQERWWEKDYLVKAGDAIGRPERVRHEGRAVEVDFTSGSVVRRIEPVEAKEGRSVTRGTTVVVWRLTGTDSDGTPFELVKP